MRFSNKSSDIFARPLRTKVIVSDDMVGQNRSHPQRTRKFESVGRESDQNNKEIKEEYIGNKREHDVPKSISSISEDFDLVADD